MKKVFIILAALAVMTFVSCGGKKEEVTKNVPLESIVGEHSDLLTVDDSIKVMLVNTDGDKWDVRASIPLTNTKSWSDVPGTDKNASEYFDAKMGNLEVVYYDANGSEIDFSVGPDWDAVASVLSSEEIKTVNISASSLWSGKSYKDAKKIYDKVASVGLKKANLSKVWKASSSSSVDDDDDIDIDVDVDDLLDDYEKALEVSKKSLEAAKKVDKSTKKAMEAYEDALDAYGSMFD